MILSANCFPCRPAISHVVRHVARPAHRIARHVTRPFHHPVQHIVHRTMRHPGKLIIAACCAGAIGPGGDALPVAPDNAPHVAYTAPLPASAGWPEMPGWSVASGALGSNAPVLIPVYERAPSPQLLDTRPVVFPRKPTNVPEPSGVAVFLLPGLWVLWVRRRMRA